MQVKIVLIQSPEKRLECLLQGKSHTQKNTSLGIREKVVGFPNSRPIGTVFENHMKSLIQHCERSELPLHFEWTFAKNAQFGEFLKI